MDLAAGFPNVQRTLQAWPGYDALQSALTVRPDLEVFIAGGAVRNLLLDPPLPVHDFDFFLGGPSVQSALAMFEAQGELRYTPYGSPRWFPAEGGGEYADLIPIHDFQPGLWRCADILDVLNQFDFTASALAFDIRTGRAFDPQNGLRDLNRRVMRMVRFDYPEGPFIPGASLSRRAILWFRILHYTTKLSFVIEPFTLEWLRSNRGFEKHAAAFSSLFFQPVDGYLGPLQ